MAERLACSCDVTAGAGRGPRSAENEVHHDALLGGPRGVACEQGGSLGRGLIRDVDAVGGHNFGAHDSINESTIGHRENDFVARSQCFEMTERLCVAGAVAGDHDVACLAWQGGAGPVSGAAIEGGQADALEHGHLDTDPWDLNDSKVITGFGRPRISRRCNRLGESRDSDSDSGARFEGEEARRVGDGRSC